MIANEEIMCLDELGMPFFKRSYKFGNMFVSFRVKFPQTLTKAQRSIIHEALHLKEQEARLDPTVKTECKLTAYEGSELDLLTKLRKRCKRYI